MTYELLKFAHIVGLALISGGAIGVFISDLRSRQLADLPLFAEAVRNIAVFYDGVVVPGALLLLISGTWLIVSFYGGWNFLAEPWLTGMVVLFACEFIEGNTVTRLYVMRMRRLTKEALKRGYATSELERARAELVPAFTHFLDIPLLMVIISLGAIRPDNWTLCIAGVVAALLLAALLTLMVPRLYPWIPRTNSEKSP
ncbi:MAG: DUF2269 domain-containing protein [Methylocystis sp.]|nr:DUF2269 domain-containing protein [Methylocystis sp.]